MITLEQMDALLDRKLDARFAAIEEKLDAKLEVRFDAIDHRFDIMDRQFVAIDRRFDTIDGQFVAIDSRFNTIEETVGDIRRRVIHLEEQTAEVQDSLADLAGAEEKDASATINHERRIAALERGANIQPKPVKHLRKFAA